MVDGGKDESARLVRRSEVGRRVGRVESLDSL